MTERGSSSRRALLSRLGGVGLAAATAGCFGGDGDDSGATSPSTDGGTDATTTDGDGDRTTTDGGGDDLDLREANVVDVSLEERDRGTRFGVTLHHDDDGEDGFADRWQVERRDGTELGRRELLHAHSEQPFTRFATVEVPADVDCVVVRGHDRTHGFGGRAMLVTLASGATRAVDQGAERTSLGGERCP